MGSLVIRASLFHRQGATGENVFEEALVRPATQEVFAKRHKSSELGNEIGREVMELCTKKVQKPPEEKIWWQRKTAIYVGG